jgi:dCTP deaminase
MLLSDQTIREMMKAGDIRLTPEPEDSAIQPISIDLTLGNSFCRLGREENHINRWIANSTLVRPGGFVLATTRERVKLAAYVAGFVHGKSTLARRGLQVEAAGLVDPGFDGCITLELKNLSHLPIPLRAGERIAQITFQVTDRAVLRPYGSPGLGSHYQGQTGAEPARG